MILILQMRNWSLEGWCSLLKELCMSDSKALLLPTTVLYWMATFWRSLDKNVFFFSFLCSMWIPSSFETRPPALEGGFSTTGHWGSSLKSLLILNAAVWSEAAPGKFKMYWVSTVENCGRFWRGLKYIFLSSDRMVERPFGPESFGCSENNIWHIGWTVDLVRRMHLISLGMRLGSSG